MEDISTFEINEPFDMHLHLRDADMLKTCWSINF